MPEDTDNPAMPESAADAERGSDRAESEIARLIAERDELNSRLVRLMADYQNSQRRAAANEKEARLEGMRSVVYNVLTVLDHFDLALAIDTSRATAEQVVNGVKVIRDELMKVLTTHGVSLINPAPGDEFTPGRHEAVMQQPVASIAPGHVASLLQPGYAISGPTGERVIRPAKVAVTPA